jgi:carboxypeptidase C (cathepsin A)
LLWVAQAFFAAHREYAKNDFFVTGESYGGHYVPAVTARLHEANKKRGGLPINLKVSILCTDVQPY